MGLIANAHTCPDCHTTTAIDRYMTYRSCPSCGRKAPSAFDALDPEVQQRLILWWRWLYGDRCEPDRPWLAAMYGGWKS